MSKMLSKEVKEVVTAKVRMLEGILCDKCGKVIPADRYATPMNRYYEVTTGHNDWGNDSFESREYHDICPECIGKFVADYFCDPKRGHNDTLYIEVQTKYCVAREVRD